ncbi:MAG: hypothetical protein OER78_00485 [Nitrosopumilus sp.]|nr:hypothetical protein [Nitrosopumilus sp.]MDH3854623.1 hypothetical protein [Nitrosopumilus sp.]
MAFADVIAPNKQLDLNFTPKEIVCKENFVKIIRTSNDQAACVSPDVVDILVKRGFGLSSNPEAISEVIEQQSTPIGKITHMATTKQYKNPGEVESFPKVNHHNYVFKVCAFEEKIKFPEIIITSDSETKSVKLPRDVRADSCNTSAVKVRASDPDSISSRLLNHGGVTEAISELEAQIASLKSEITIQREKLSSINDEIPSNDRAKKVSAIHKKISDIRNELKSVRAELQKYLLLLSLSSTSDLSPIAKNKSITGVDVDGIVSEIISVNKALIQPEDRPENSMVYNIVFEICTDNTSLRIPVVELSSDIATKTVKMAEKIPSNSCQVSTGKINALDANSIAIQLAGQTQSSETILSLEKKIESLKDEMKIEQEKLNSVSTSSAISKQERQISITESTIKSQELRKELNSTKAELHKILLQVYR